MKTKIYGLLAACGLFAASCASSVKITSSWRETDKTLAFDKLNRVLVVALFNNETSRRKAEDQMARLLDGKGVVAYEYLEKINKNNEEAIRDKIRADGFDGAVTMRLVDVDKEINYTPGNFSTYPVYYRNFSGYYFRNRDYYSNPGSYSTTKIYTVETNVYSIKEDKIIWSGLTESTNPEGVQKMTGEIAKVVYRRMLKEGFIHR